VSVASPTVWAKLFYVNKWQGQGVCGIQLGAVILRIAVDVLVCGLCQASEEDRKEYRALILEVHLADTYGKGDH
jgi:hypothetical protein